MPLDSAHGLIDGIEPGNRVDVYAGFNVIPLGADGRPINGGQARPMLRLILADVPGRSRSARRAAATGSTNVSLARRRRQSGEARLRLRQRQAVAGAAAERGREGVAARHRHRRDHAPRRSAGADPEVGRGPSVNSRGLPRLRGARGEPRPGRDPGGTAGRHAAPRGVAGGGGARQAARSSTGADLVIVGCSQAHEQALEVISAATAQRADRPVVVLYHGSPNGFLERAFEAGADDLVSLPQSVGPARLRVREGARAESRRADVRRPRAR